MKLREIVKGILSLIVAFSYLIVSTGFSLHICSVEDSVDVILFNSAAECSELHSHSHNHHHCHSCHLNDQEDDEKSATHSHFECCNTKLFHLDQEAESPINLQNSDQHSLLKGELSIVLAGVLSSSAPLALNESSLSLHQHNQNLPPGTTHQLLATYSKWLL